MSAPVEQGDDRNDLTTIPLDHAPYKYSRDRYWSLEAAAYWIPRFRGVRRPMMKLHFTFFAAFFTAAFFPSASSASRTCLNSLRSALSTLGKCRSSWSSALTMVEPIT